ncbi:hypothetical protein ACFU44_00375 [Nocardia rhizosphaerihabitans]|uniref:hypothetical protein n=1 Tax=Nocardia rhizosphaerihabitans TaxID=1691570 RepID=UPI00366CF2BA
MPVGRHPAVLVAIAYLSPLLPVPVFDEVDAERPASFVRVTRVGGPRWNEVTDGPMLTFECFAPRSAETLCVKVADLVEDMPGQFVEYIDDFGAPRSAWINSFAEVGGPSQLKEEPVPDSDRWLYTARVGIATNI